jgi:hypothetical protein
MAVHVTRDSFATWQYDTIGIGGNNNLRIMTADLNGNMYLATGNGLFFQDSVSTVWTSIGFFAGRYVNYIFCARTGDLYASANLSVYKSTDHGQTWLTDTVGMSRLKGVSFGDDSVGNTYAIMTSGYSSSSGNLVADRSVYQCTSAGCSSRGDV